MNICKTCGGTMPPVGPCFNCTYPNKPAEAPAPAHENLFGMKLLFNDLLPENSIMIRAKDKTVFLDHMNRLVVVSAAEQRGAERVVNALCRNCKGGIKGNIVTHGCNGCAVGKFKGGK